jgi:hypothetical protein
MEKLGRPLPESHDSDCMICIGRLQPDLVLRLVSQSLRKIAIVQVSRPMDGSLPVEQLAEAHKRKMRTYVPLLEALQADLDEGWQAEILP